MDFHFVTAAMRGWLINCAQNAGDGVFSQGDPVSPGELNVLTYCIHAFVDS